MKVNENILAYSDMHMIRSIDAFAGIGSSFTLNDMVFYNGQGFAK